MFGNPASLGYCSALLHIVFNINLVQVAQCQLTVALLHNYCCASSDGICHCQPLFWCRSFDNCVDWCVRVIYWFLVCSLDRVRYTYDQSFAMIISIDRIVNRKWMLCIWIWERGSSYSTISRPIFIILHSHNTITIPITFQILVQQHQCDGKTMAVMIKTNKTSA